MFDNVKVGDEVKICFPPMKFQTEPARVDATVIEVKADTFCVTYLADVYQRGEYRKSDGKSIRNDDDYGWIE